MPPAIDRAAFLGALIGKRYQAGASGPDQYDCYGLAAHVLENLFGVALPSRETGPLSSYRSWPASTTPEDGALVVMNNGKGRHIGVWLGPERGVLHALDGVGVIFDDLSSLAMRGFNYRFRVYR